MESRSLRLGTAGYPWFALLRRSMRTAVTIMSANPPQTRPAIATNVITADVFMSWKLRTDNTPRKSARRRLFPAVALSWIMARIRIASLAVLMAASVPSCRDAAGPETRVAAAIQPVGGDGQTASIGTTLDDALVVRVEDASGQPVSGARVLFSVQSGGGSVAPGDAFTNANGLAQSSWTLGSLVETEQRVWAIVPRANGEPLRAVFTAQADPTGPVAAVTSLEPALLVPGGQLAITGGNLEHVERITVAGVAVDIVDRTAGSLTAQLPVSGFSCAPTQDVSVMIATSGGEVLRVRSLRIADERPLAVGQVLLATAEDPLACIELPPDGSRYVIAVANVARDMITAPGLRVRGVTSSAVPTVTETAAQVAAAPAATAAPIGVARAGDPLALRTAALRHESILRANAEMARSLTGPVLARAVAPAAVREDPVVGDTRIIRIPRLGGGSAAELCATYDSVLTRVAHVSARAVILEDVDSPLAGAIDSLYQAVATEFDTRQYDVLRQNFADPLRLGSRVLMVFSRRVNNQNVSGFVWAGDLAPRSQCTQSNEAEVFYGYVPVTGGIHYAAGTRAEWYWTIRPTVVHEIKHIASMSARAAAGVAPESPWLDEATAMVAEELWARRVFGYEQHANTAFQESVGCEIDGAFARPPCVGMPSAMFAHYLLLSAWMQEPGARSLLGPTSGQDASYYGSGWLFLRWLLDNAAGSEAFLLRELIAAEETGIDNVEARFGRPFETALPQWAATVALDDRAGSMGPAQLRIPSWNLRDVFSGLNREQPALFPTAFPLRVRTFGFGNVQTDVSMVRGGGAVYFELTGTWAGPQALAFQGLGGGTLPAPFRVIVVRLE